MTLQQQAQCAKEASYRLLTVDTKTKNAALCAMADALETQTDAILAANALDLAAARDAGRTEALLDRLALSPARISGMAGGLRKVASLPDPVGGADAVFRRPNGLSIEKRRVPLGVVGIIYEARPNVTADAIGLCLKSSNACLLRGGSEAIRTNIAVADCLAEAAENAGIPKGAIQLVRDTSRETATEMMRLNGYLDVLIPRGGAGLIQSVVRNATVPVIETGAGICHTYFDSSGDVVKGAAIIHNAKTRRVSVCNALDCLLVHASRLADLPALCAPLSQSRVLIYADEPALAALTGHYPSALLQAAVPESYGTEYLDYKMAIKTVSSLEEALEHISRYGSRHSESIVTEDREQASRFLCQVDAACVYHNAPTSFTDGAQFGLGAEIGISTQKLHARGPMALEEITTYKWLIEGDGQVRV